MTTPERRNLEKPDRRAMLPRFGGRRATDSAPRQRIAIAKKVKENAVRPPRGKDSI